MSARRGGGSGIARVQIPLNLGFTVGENSLPNDPLILANLSGRAYVAWGPFTIGSPLVAVMAGVLMNCSSNFAPPVGTSIVFHVFRDNSGAPTGSELAYSRSQNPLAVSPEARLIGFPIVVPVSLSGDVWFAISVNHTIEVGSLRVLGHLGSPQAYQTAPLAEIPWTEQDPDVIPFTQLYSA